MNETKMGPQTEEGRMAVTENAVSHGLRSDRPVIPGLEDHLEWEAHLQGIIENLGPEGRLEEELAERIASLFWRLRRITRYELAVVTREIDDTEEDLAIAEAYGNGTLAKGIFPKIDLAEIARAQEARVLPTRDDLEKIMRYEAHLHRQCLQTLHELEALQARRQGERTPLTRLDVSAPPAAYLGSAREKDLFS